MALTLTRTGPTLRGEVVSGRDQGTVSFGSLRDWQSAHGGTDTVRFSLAAAAGGMPCRFRDRRGSIWRLELHRPAQAGAPAWLRWAPPCRAAVA